MDATDLLVLALCFAGGFWLISALTGKGVQGWSAWAGGAKPRRRWFDVLGVTQFCTKVELQQAYKQKVEEFEPAKLAWLGPELRAAAEERLRELSEAYALGMRRRGGAK